MTIFYIDCHKSTTALLLYSNLGKTVKRYNFKHNTDGVKKDIITYIQI